MLEFLSFLRNGWSFIVIYAIYIGCIRINQNGFLRHHTKYNNNNKLNIVVFHFTGKTSLTNRLCTILLFSFFCFVFFPLLPTLLLVRSHCFFFSFLFFDFVVFLGWFSPCCFYLCVSVRVFKKFCEGIFIRHSFVCHTLFPLCHFAHFSLDFVYFMFYSFNCLVLFMFIMHCTLSQLEKL